MRGTFCPETTHGSSALRQLGSGAVYEVEAIPVTSERLDEETVAAFLDGTLPEMERARVLRALAENPEAYAEFIDAARVAAQARDEVDNASIPLVRPRRWRYNAILGGSLLAAAGIVGVVFVSRGGPRLDTIDMVQGARLATARGAGSVEQTLGSDWSQPAWSVVRGSGAGTSSPGTAARVGARFAQLEYAAAASDSVAWSSAAATLSDLMTSIEGTGPIVEQLRGASVPDGDERASMGRQLRELTAAPSGFDIGAWLETARLAAVSGQGSFFRADGPGIAALTEITSALERDTSAGPWSGVLGQARELHALAGPAPDLQLVRRVVDAAMAAIPR